MLRSASDLIDKKGGPAAVAKATGHTPGAVSVWRHRNKLPRSAWPELVEAYPELTLADLKAIEAAAE